MNKKITIAIISILTLALVTGGFWWWQNNKKDEMIQQAEQAENQEQSQNTEVENTINLVWYEIPELGIKIKADEEIIKELIYKYYPSEDDEYGTVMFTAKKLEKLYENCSAEFGPLGAISKIEGSPSNHKTRFENYFNSRKTKQFDGFFIYCSGPQALCTRELGQWEKFLEENPKLKGWMVLDTIELID